eukprot:GGOE01062185.1.p1 GENE.GGOE01062185.1~~GGOE01062185.1.p1  ORF type:complete len:740 (-),score=205.50 GGOE01062185.1:175-2310(-)
MTTIAALTIGPSLKSFQGRCSAPHSIVTYDELTDCVVVVQGMTVHMCPVHLGRQVNTANASLFSHTVEVAGVEGVRIAKRNKDGTILAALHTDTRLVFCGVAQRGAPMGCAGASYEVRLGLVPYLRNADHNAIKGFFWVDTAHLLIITHVRVDLLEVQLEKGQVGKVNGLNATPDAWHYCGATQQLLLLNLRKRTRLRLLQVKGQSVVETHIIRLEAPCSGSCVVQALPYRGQTLLLLCDVGRRVATSWLVGLEGSGAPSRFFTALLPDIQGDYAVSLVDHCLILHHLAAQRSYLFDLPLPSLRPYDSDAVRPTASLSLRSDGAADRADWYLPGEVSYHFPNLILDQHHGHLYELSISIPAILAAHPKRTNPLSVATFLLKRRGGLQSFEEQLREWLRNRRPLTELAEVFKRINAGYAQVYGQKGSPLSPPHLSTPTSFHIVNSFDRDLDLPEGPCSPVNGEAGSVGVWQSADARAAPQADSIQSMVFPPAAGEPPCCLARPDDGATTLDGFIVPHQDRLCAEVFQPVHAEGHCPTKYFLAVVVEYCRSLEEASSSSDPRPDLRMTGLPLQDMIVDLLIHSHPPDYHRLHQFIQFRVIDDQIPIAQKLLGLESAFPPGFQLAMDMLSRLKEWKLITELLMDRGRMVQAVELLIRHEATEALQNLEQLLDRVTTCGDEQEVFTAVHLLQAWRSQDEANPEVRQTADFLSQLM